jgi:uncharacterized RDD family membrane protein YckC
MASIPSSDVRFCSECGRQAPLDELARFGNTFVCEYCKATYIQKLREGVQPASAGAALTYAGFWIRFVASLLDWIILFIVDSTVQALVLTPFFHIKPIGSNAAPGEFMAQFLALFGVSTAINFLIGCTYETLFIARLGATPGKMALSLKVVRPDGGPVDLGRALGRYFAKILSGLILLIGYIIAGFDSQKRALHDMICETRVVKKQD